MKKIVIRSTGSLSILMSLTCAMSFAGNEEAIQAMRRARAEKRFLENYRASLPGYRGQQTLENQLTVSDWVQLNTAPKQLSDLPAEMMAEISNHLDPVGAINFSASCTKIHDVTKNIVEQKRKEFEEAQKAKVAEKVEALLNTRYEANDWNVEDKIRNELETYIVELANRKSPLLAIAFQQTDKGHSKTMANLQKKMVKKAFNDRRFEELKYLLLMGADPSISGHRPDRETYTGINDKQANICSWAIANGHNDILKATLLGLKGKYGIYGEPKLNLLSDSHPSTNPIKDAIRFRNIDAAKVIIDHTQIDVLVMWLSTGNFAYWNKKEKIPEIVDLLSSSALLKRLENHLSVLNDDYQIHVTEALIQQIKKFQAEKKLEEISNPHVTTGEK